MKILSSLCLAAAMLFPWTAGAVFYTVTGTADNTDSATHGGSGTAGSPFQMSSLRGATIAANANPGSTIILPAGTYQLTIPGDANDRNFVSFDATKGDLDISGSGTTIQGAGPSLTTIQQTTGADRILTDNPSSVIGFTFTMTGIKLTGGRDATTFEGGGAIFVGGQNNLTTISNCAFVNNQMTGGAGNGGGAICNTGGNLNVLNCTFGGTGATDPNVSTVSGGAIAYNSSDFVNSGGSGVATISGCTFTTNSATSTSSGGGALVVSQSNLSTATAVVTNCVFKGNKNSNGNGGAISLESGTLTVVACTFDSNQAQGNGHGGVSRSTGGTTNTFTYCRFINNTAATAANGNVLSFGSSGGSFTANNNWWGQNTGPAINAIDASAGSAAITVANWLQLRHAANPNTIFVPNSTTLTATFLTNSAGTLVPAANLGALTGVPVTFNNAVRGTLSGAQATMQAAGTATATFTANAAGAGSADTVVDSQTVTASITIPTGVSSINRVNLSPTNLTSVSWTVTFTNAVSGVAAGNFSLVNGGLGGAPAISSVIVVGGAPATSWTVTAGTGSGTGTLGLNMANGTGVSASIVNLPFTGQVYTIDLVAPDTSITAQPASLTNTASASFSFTGSDTGVGVASFQYQLDGGAYTTATSPVNLSGLSSAAHTFNVRAIDGAGNTDASPATVTWTVDTVPPTVNCSTNVIVTANGYCPTNVSYTVSVSDNLALSLATTNPASGSAFSVGTNTVTLTARDTAGNTNFCTFKVIVLAGAAPQLSILRSGTNVVVSWTNLFPCYTLQFAPVLASNSWSSYPGPFATNNGKIFVTNTAPFTDRFFRLKF